MPRHVEKTRAGGTWSEARFWQFIRSGLRQVSRRWPPLVRLSLNNVRRKYVGPNKRQLWEYQCAVCGGWFKRTQVEVDHVEPCGSLRSFADLQVFAARLFCETDKLRVVCETCHAAITRLPASDTDTTLATLRRQTLLQRGGRPSE